MTIAIGDRIPEVTLKHLRDGIQTIDTPTLFDHRRVVLFGLPGAFTPTCSERHLPGYAAHFDAFREQGIEVYCVSVNDPFVMRAWGKSLDTPAGLQLLADGNADFTRALGLEMDASANGMGVRSRRYALYADNGVVQQLWIEGPGDYGVSSAEQVLQYLHP